MDVQVEVSEKDETHIIQAVLSFVPASSRRYVRPLHNMFAKGNNEQRKHLFKLFQLHLLVELLQADAKMVCTLLARGDELVLTSNTGFTPAQVKDIKELFLLLRSGSKDDQAEARKILLRRAAESVEATRKRYQEALKSNLAPKKRTKTVKKLRDLVDISQESSIRAAAQRMETALDDFPTVAEGFTIADMKAWILSKDCLKWVGKSFNTSVLSIVRDPCPDSVLLTAAKLEAVLKRNRVTLDHLDVEVKNRIDDNFPKVGISRPIINHSESQALRPSPAMTEIRCPKKKRRAEVPAEGETSKVKKRLVCTKLGCFNCWELMDEERCFSVGAHNRVYGQVRVASPIRPRVLPKLRELLVSRLTAQDRPQDDDNKSESSLFAFLSCLCLPPDPDWSSDSADGTAAWLYF